jgi:hypothetical protein
MPINGARSRAGIIPHLASDDWRTTMAGAGDDPQVPGDRDPEPRARLMHEVAEQMDAIEADFPGGFEIGRVITIAEIVLPEGRIELRIRAGQLPWVTLGILDWAKKNIEDATRRGAPDE